MHTFLNQTLASTNLDSQGERLSRFFLQRCCARMVGRRFPINQQHDISMPVAGYIENVRVMESATSPGEWQLVGDVYVDKGTVSDVIGGFSISGLEMLRESQSASALCYVPFPQYNDTELIDELQTDPDLNVGKWIKKSAEPVGWMILGSVLTIVVAPIWDDVYKRKIAPRIDSLLEKYLPLLRSKALAAELVQIVEFNGEDVEVRIIPTRGREEVRLHSSCVRQGLNEVVNFLLGDQKALNVGVDRVVIFFDEAIAAYKLHRLEYSDGSVDHLA
jgi:hypothetical protein